MKTSELVYFIPLDIEVLCKVNLGCSRSNYKNDSSQQMYDILKPTGKGSSTVEVYR